LKSFSQPNKQQRLLSQILKKNPVPIPEVQKKRPKAVLGGPFIGHPDLSTISERQRELEAKLKIESLKLFHKKYPYRASIYG
jgi:hypothetical protein